MPKSFWGEALSTAAHLVNKSPSTVLNLRCPEEIWTSRKLNLNYLRVFGCEAYVHQSEGKLEPRSMKCVFVGYQEGIKGYRLWNRHSGGVKIIISRDVLFSKVVFPCKLTNINVGTKTRTPNDYVITRGTQIEVEQPVGVDDLPVAPTSQEPDTGDDHLPTSNPNQTSNHEIDQEENNDPEIEVEQHDSSQQDLKNYQLTRDKRRRAIRPPARYAYTDLVFCALVVGMEIRSSEPSNYEEAVNSQDCTKWQQAIDEEMASLMANGT